MTPDLENAVDGHRHLSQRINRHLIDIETAGRQPGQLEGDQILKALSSLESEEFAEGEQAMVRARTAMHEPDGNLHPAVTVDDLRQLLEVLDRSIA